MTRLQRFTLLLLSAWFLGAPMAFGIERFPPPQFDSDYTVKTPTTPPARAEWLEALDVGLLVAALALASWLVLKKRNRKAVVGLMLVCLLYFGFWRQGCICPIGATGNVALGIFNPEYPIPWFVVAFFFLPLVFTLFFGRTFCAAVCPLGAVQDVVLLKPLKVPAWLEAALRLVAWLYLSLAVLFAATASSMIICRYDPFVSFFRFNANAAMWVISFSMLAIAVFVGRPYCRFLCPYGLLFRQIGRISRSCVTITPDECIHCRLCEDACPFGAIEKPTVQWPQNEYVKGKRRLMIMIIALPLLIPGGTGLGYLLHPRLAQAHPDVQLARRVRLEQAGVYQETTDASEAFYASTQSAEQLFAKADAKQGQFAVGSAIVGGWMGLVAGLSLIQYSIFWKRKDYHAHRSACMACGRCYNACPQHRLWVKNKKETGRTDERSE